MLLIILLHNSILTLDDLKNEGFNIIVLKAVLFLTKKNNQSYIYYLKQVTMCDTAISVKIADLTHNLPNLKKCSLIDKYEMALFILSSYDGVKLLRGF